MTFLQLHLRLPPSFVLSASLPRMEDSVGTYFGFDDFVRTYRKYSVNRSFVGTNAVRSIDSIVSQKLSYQLLSSNQLLSQETLQLTSKNKQVSGLLKEALQMNAVRLIESCIFNFIKPLSSIIH